MALSATIYKAEINIADNDRAYYGSHVVTVARHPSETEERLMIRILAYALYENGDEMLAFTRGLSEADEPDLWRKDLTGTILQWIETGLPDERRLLKACGRAGQVVVLAYGRNAATWWANTAGKLERARNLKVYMLPMTSTQKLAALAGRNMSLHFNVQDGTVWVSSDKGEADIEIQALN
ncbi:YaeQ family protein [Advenella sp. RU8]|uniref:YaeQ family protein n=1 Tax=Advenella sp. RU8 TaxID=3399575 RepID=UPI003AB0063D